MSIVLVVMTMMMYEACTVSGNSASIVKREPKPNTVSLSILPSNNNDSIQYLLYTPENPNEVCYFEPDDSNKCSINPKYETKLLIHGYKVQLLPGNLFEQIKDALLKNNKYNIIIVNWTKYNGQPYVAAIAKAYLVGTTIGKMINSLVSDRGFNASDFHIIGHSLGAHVAGVAGKQVENLGRVTGLDPAGPLFTKLVKYNRIADNSAQLVDVIHTSTGLGFSRTLGSIDFYPNGGKEQTACQMGNKYRNADNIETTISSKNQLESCNHNIALVYFMNSIDVCNYLSVECSSYKEYSEGNCDSESYATNRMGLHCKDIPGLPAESTFYLTTAGDSPYCENK